MILNTIEQCDYRDFISTIPDKSIDLLLTDPPYNASKSALSASSGYKTMNQEWDKDFDPNVFVKMILPKLKDNGQMLVFCSIHLLVNYLNMQKEFGSKMEYHPIDRWKQVLHWYKTNSLPCLTGKMYGFAIEYILWYCKSKEYTFDKSQRASYLNVFESQVGVYKVTDHQCEKPIGLIRQLVRTHSLPSDTVCDLFMGSGTTAVACKESNRNFVGCEIDPRWVEVANKRLQECGRQGDLL